MRKTIDARGLSCPQPVLMTLDGIKAGDTTKLEILVDTNTSKENVTRAAESQGWTVSDVHEEGVEYTLTITKKD